ncbi:MAG: hypothetical protein ABI234_18150, partial [Ktedonobacteraceae bacterium]
MNNTPSGDPHHTLISAEIPLERTSAWEAIIGMLAVGLLYAALPAQLIIGPSWLLLVIEAVLLLPLIITISNRRGLSHKAIRVLILILLGVLTLALAIGVALLIITLPTDKHATNLLRSSVLLWSSNILVFGLWYWQIDGGGPVKRHFSGHQAADFMFPQQVNGNTDAWVPHFLDYLFLAFTGATALSPADTYPLTRAGKSLMMLEA